MSVQSDPTPRNRRAALLAAASIGGLLAATKQADAGYLPLAAQLITVANVAALQTLMGPLAAIWLAGYYTAGDLGAGVFVLGATATANGGTIINDGAGRSWYRETEGRPYSVGWFGAKIDGSTNDSAAVQSCITAAAAVGRGVYFPSGSCVCSGIAVANAMDIAGAGKYESVISNPSLTADTIDVVAVGFVSIHDLGFTSSVVKTAGTFVNFGVNPNCTLSEFFMSDYWIGVDFSGAITQLINGIMESGVASGPTPQSGGIRVGSAGQNDAQKISNVIMSAQISAQPSFGILLLASGDITIDNTSVISHGNCLLVAPPTGVTIASLWATNSFFDSAVNGIVLAPVTGAEVARCRFDSCWTSSHSGSGVNVGMLSGGGTIAGVHFVDHQSLLNTAGNGLAIFQQSIDITVNGGTFAANANGIFVAPGTTDFSIIGVSAGAYGGVVGNSGYGIIVESGVSNRYIVSLNRTTGNTTSGLADGGTGSDKFVGNNIT